MVVIGKHSCEFVDTSSEDEDTKLPEKRRVTAQIMRKWEQHKAIEDKPPISRSEKMLRLHRAQLFDAITRTDEGDMGHSILQEDMPDDEDYHDFSQQQEEALILAVCVALVLPPHSLMAGGATQICMDVVVLPVT